MRHGAGEHRARPRPQHPECAAEEDRREGENDAARRGGDERIEEGGADEGQPGRQKFVEAPAEGELLRDAEEDRRREDDDTVVVRDRSDDGREIRSDDGQELNGHRAEEEDDGERNPRSGTDHNRVRSGEAEVPPRPWHEESHGNPAQPRAHREQDEGRAAVGHLERAREQDGAEDEREEQSDEATGAGESRGRCVSSLVHATPVALVPVTVADYATPTAPHGPVGGSTMRIFVSGASGYIGSRLIPRLLEDGHEVRAGFRDPQRAQDFDWASSVEAVAFDIGDGGSVAAALDGIDVAYYLVHSMSGADFVRRDHEGAVRFSCAADENALRRIVYLSGLVPDGDLSDHIRSRLDVEKVLLAAATPAVVLRAAIILGSGSTSFELIRRLVERLPVLPRPSWLQSSVAPIATEDVVDRLARAATIAEENRHIDVAGPEQLRYSALVARYAAVAGLPRPQFPLPHIPRRLAGPIVGRITGMPEGTVSALVASLGHDMVASPADWPGDAPAPLGIDEALRRALSPEQSATRGGDLQTGARSDPEWAGGDIEIDHGRRRRTGRGLWARVTGTAR